MNILFIIIGFCSVFGTQEQENDGSDSSLSTNQYTKQSISSELDEIGFERPINGMESKGSALQRLLSSVNFVCKGRFEGYYADTEFGCQTFHYCKPNGLRFTFVCPPHSIFNQKEMTCDHNVLEPHKLCIESHNYYYLNAILYAQKKEAINDTDIPSIVSKHNSSRIWPLFHQKSKKDFKNTSKPNEELILPFKGFNSLDFKNNSLNQTNERRPQLSNQIESNSQQINIKMISNLSNISSEEYKHNNNSSKIKEMIENSLKKTNFSNISKNLLKNNSIEREFYNKTADHIDWDDEHKEHTDIKIPQIFSTFKPNFNEHLNSLGVVNYANTPPITLPPLPVPVIKSDPLVLLRPNIIRGTLPIATLYKQTEYMFGKPHIIHKGLYLNPSYGAAIVGPQSLGSVQPFVSSIGLIQSPSERFNTKIFPKNPKIFSNFQNVLTKFSLNDIFGLRSPLNQISPKRKGSDKTDNILKMSQTSGKPLDISNKKIQNFHKNRIIFNERLSNEETPLKPNKFSENNIPLNLIVFNSRPFDFQSNTKQKPKKNTYNRNPKYSLKMDESFDSLHIITQPSIFANITDDKRKKWIENYAKIKKKYLEREKKSQQNKRNDRKTNL